VPENELNRFLCVGVDIQGYSGQEIHGQHDFQAALHAAISGAAADARIDQPSWQEQPQGDGELALVPAGADELRMMDSFVMFLRARLRQFNEPRIPGQRMRVRLAFHSGWARQSALGYSGSDVVAVGRLVGAPALKSALSVAGEADLGVIVSDTAFTILRQGLTTVPVAEFHEVDVIVKEFHGRAWIWIPGATVRQPPPAPAPAPPPSTPAAGQNMGIVITGGTVSGPMAAGSGARAYQGRPPVDEGGEPA
jgi:hypothetical protein